MGWLVVRPGGLGGPGVKVRRLGPVCRWVAWPHANAARADYFVARGWSLTRERALSAGWASLA